MLFPLMAAARSRLGMLYGRVEYMIRIESRAIRAPLIVAIANHISFGSPANEMRRTDNVILSQAQKLLHTQDENRLEKR